MAVGTQPGLAATQPVDVLDVDDQVVVQHLPQTNPVVKTAVELTKAFATMARQRQRERLEAWLAK